MADQEPSAGGNGADNNAQPQVTILAQYVKDLSVENPNAPQVFPWQLQPQIDVQFNISADNAGENVHEVTLKFDISARSDNGVHFVVDLIYAGPVRAPQRARGAAPAVPAGRGAAAALPVRPPGDRRRRVEHAASRR